MESVPPQKQTLVSSFLEIAVGQTAETALQFLQATNWQLEEAIQLFYVGNDGVGGVAQSLPSSLAAAPGGESSMPKDAVTVEENVVQASSVEDEVRAPLPVKREVLYDDAAFYRLNPGSVVAFRNFQEESRRSGVWENDQGNGPTSSSLPDNLASLYRPPFELIHKGSFDKAKVDASRDDKWLLVNLQSTEEFSSHMLNRDTWGNEAVAQTILSNFIFWQVYHDTSEGKKVCTYYKTSSVPVILVIDPITGQKMRAWSGMVHPDRLLEDLLPFMDRGPNEHHVALPLKRQRGSTQPSTSSIHDEDEEVHRAIAESFKDAMEPVVATDNVEENEVEEVVKSSSEQPKLPNYPPLPEEPKINKDLTCRVGIRLPNGRRLQRNFLLTDSTQLLWSFCSCEFEEAANRAFHFTQGFPGATKSVIYEDKLKFKESGVVNSMIILTWD